MRWLIAFSSMVKRSSGRWPLEGRRNRDREKGGARRAGERGALSLVHSSPGMKEPSGIARLSPQPPSPPGRVGSGIWNPGTAEAGGRGWVMARGPVISEGGGPRGGLRAEGPGGGCTSLTRGEQAPPAASYAAVSMTAWPRGPRVPRPPSWAPSSSPDARPCHGAAAPRGVSFGSGSPSERGRRPRPFLPVRAWVLLVVLNAGVFKKTKYNSSPK